MGLLLVLMRREDGGVGRDLLEELESCLLLVASNTNEGACCDTPLWFFFAMAVRRPGQFRGIYGVHNLVTATARKLSGTPGLRAVRIKSRSTPCSSCRTGSHSRRSGSRLRGPCSGR